MVTSSTAIRRLRRSTGGGGGGCCVTALAVIVLWRLWPAPGPGGDPSVSMLPRGLHNGLSNAGQIDKMMTDWGAGQGIASDARRSTLALALAVIGGALMGSYPVFIKTDAVLKAEPHPLVFQLYKSAVVFATGWLFLLPRAWQGIQPDEQLLVLTPWGCASAAAWVPSGLATIWAVPKLGIGMSISLNAATASSLSFFVFVAVFDTKLKAHSCGEGCTFHMAPVYLLCTLLGVAGMIFASDVATKVGCGSGVGRPRKRSSSNAKLSLTPTTAPVWSQSWWEGVGASVFAGIFAAVQFSAVTLGKRHEQRSAGCLDDPATCPTWLVEAFNNVGSWNVSFGCGAITITGAAIVAQTAVTGRSLDMHWDVLHTAGLYGGLLWAGGNAFITAAIVIGGNAVVVAQAQSAIILFSGLHGIFTYGEIKGLGVKAVWVAAAGWTLCFMALLGFEKGS